MRQPSESVERDAGEGVEEVGGDQDAGPPATPEQVEADDERDQAEGEG